MLSLNFSILDEWKSINGDNTKLTDYELDENSKILELGGYDGTWIRKMISKYDPFVFVIEPVPSFFNKIKEQFKENPKFKILNVGVSSESKEGVIYLDNDSTSTYVSNTNPINVKFETMEKILSEFGETFIDLLQINIEGEEYSLLERMIENGTINRFRNIQVQFHIGIEEFENRRNSIRAGLLENGFVNHFNFPFIWEGWSKVN